MEQRGLYLSPKIKKWNRGTRPSCSEITGDIFYVLNVSD